MASRHMRLTPLKFRVSSHESRVKYNRGILHSVFFLILIFAVLFPAAPAFAGGREEPASRKPPKKIENITFEQLIGDGKAPEGVKGAKAREVLQILQNLISREKAPYVHEKAVEDLNALEIDVPKYLEFFFTALEEFPKKNPGVIPKTNIYRLLSEIVYLYRFFPGTDMVAVLSKLIDGAHTDLHHRALAVEALPGAGGVSTAGILARCLLSGEERIRTLAKLQFISLRHENPDADLGSPVLEVLKGLNSPPYAKNEAVIILAIFKDKRMVAPLVRNLLFYDVKTAVNGIRALGIFRDRESKDASVPVLKHALASGVTTAHRRWAAISLGLLGDWKAIPPLINALTDRDEKVREAAHNALRKLTKKKFSPNQTLWKNWYEGEGKAGRPRRAPERTGAQTPVRFTAIPGRKTTRPSIRPTVVGGNAAGRNASPARAGARPAPISRKRNIILFILAGILVLSIIAIFFFFRKGQGKK